jgi:hypothetical protein
LISDVWRFGQLPVSMSARALFSRNFTVVGSSVVPHTELKVWVCSKVATFGC